MQKWEYLRLSATRDEKSDFKWSINMGGTHRSYSEIAHVLNELGAEGWELVGVSTFIGSTHPEGRFYSLTLTYEEALYFKRQISN